MVAGIQVRPARPGDQADLARIYRRASLSNAGDRAALLAHPDALLLSDGLIDRGRTRVVMTEGIVIGFASTRRTATGVAELDDLFVDPAYRRRGAARALLRQLVGEVRREGITRLEVTANDHARDFYDVTGFLLDGRQVTEFGVGSRMHLEITRCAPP